MSFRPVRLDEEIESKIPLDEGYRAKNSGLYRVRPVPLHWYEVGQKSKPNSDNEVGVVWTCP